MAVKVIPSTKQGLLPTPAMPRGLLKAELTDNARQVLVKRYVRRGDDGQPVETVEEMFWRVAYHVAKAEEAWGGDVNARAVEFYRLLTSKKFFPNSPTFTGAGTPLGQLAACQPYHARVVTSRGLIPIGELVEKQTASDVVTFQSPESDEPVSAYRAASANFGPARLGKILAGVPNGVRPVMRVTVLGGVHLDVTPDHLVWASPPSKHGRFGWHEAGEIEPGWLLMVDSRPKPFPAEQVEGFDEATAAVVAWLQADGYVGQPATATSPIVEFETIHDDEFNWIQEQIARTPLVEFHQKVHEEVVQNEALQYRRIRIYGKEPYALLRQYGLAERKAAARVPEQVFRSPVSVVASYLRALFQCDGSVERSGFISLSSVSCQLLEGVQLLLLQLGISSQIIAYHHSREGRLPNYKLHIGLYSSRVLFEQKVGFVSREKQEKLATLNQQGGKQQSTLRAVEVDRVVHLGEMPVFDIQTSDSTYLSAHLAVHNCFVLPITDDMGRDRAGIFQTLRDAALIQQTGGGNGFSFSRLRPKGGLVKSSAGQATGPVGFLRVYDHAFGEVAQGGTRRGANMAVLRVDHPDVEEFIECKTNENHITNFNISVGITDAFMRAVKEDEEWELRFPDIAAREYRNWSGTLEQAERTGMPIRSYGKVRARYLFDKIVKQAHHNGEPGVLFLDAANRGNPVPHLYQLESTNPCGEQFLGPYENCCLGSVNLNEHCGADGAVDWESLRQSVVTATRFLDDVVEANAYVPAVPQLKEAAHRARRIGLGIMGLADLMYHAGVRYGSKEGQEFGAQVMEFVRYHAMQASIELAEARGPFPAIEGSIYDPDGLKWTPPQPLTPYQNRWTRPEVKWEAILDGIRRHGIRNAAQTTVAPTGCLVPGTLVTTNHGLLPIEALGNTRGEQWQNIDLRVSSEGGALPATKFYINGPAHTLRVVTRRGYTLQGTAHHRLRVLEHGEWVWKRLDELKAGMRVPLQMSGLIENPQRVLLNASLATDLHPVTVKLPEEMSPELAYLVGFFMGDGSLKTRSLRFSVSDERLQRHIASLLEKAFGVCPEAYADKRSSHLISLDLHSINVVEFWKNNGFAKQKPSEEHQGKGYLPHIPLAILRANDIEIYGAFLAGLFDADGTSHNGRLLTWVSTHRQFHDQIKVMLFALGILTTSDIQRTGKSNHPLYRLRVSHTQSANRSSRLLPYLARLSFDTSSVRRATLGDVIPITEGEYQSVLALAENGAEEQRVWGWRQRGWTASRESLSNFVERHRQALGEAGLDRLAEIVEGEIYFDDVATVEDGGVQDTYDISVPVTHAYIANGFISHNTIATVAGCEGYGCEPVFALAYIRHVNDHGKDLRLTYASPRFDEALKKLGLGEEKRQEIVEQVMSEGSCQRVSELPQSVRDTFVVSADISAEEHVRMQATLQAFTDNAISKTVNFPENASVEDVANAYLLAWELGCKGITVYVTGSREKVVLETKATADKKAPAPPPDLEPAPASTGVVWRETKKPRPRALTGRTFNVETPVGKAFITINANGGEQPFEVFINTSKAGSETAAVSEAIGRLISYILRMASPIVPTDRMKEIVRQLMGIGGGRSLGFGPNRVRSLPDGIGQVLDHYLREKSGLSPDPVEEKSNGGHITLEAEAAENVPPMRIGDLCPECGEAAVVNEEGCRKCYACGYSEC
jgi:ribonucleoside-diphosphate reductase alpha chain